jgi:hypothetical protein
LLFAVGLAGIAALLGRLDLPVDAGLAAWLSAIGSGVLYYAIAFWFYLNGLPSTRPGIGRRAPERRPLCQAENEDPGTRAGECDEP